MVSGTIDTLRTGHCNQVQMVSSCLESLEPKNLCSRQRPLRRCLMLYADANNVSLATKISWRLDVIQVRFASLLLMNSKELVKRLHHPVIRGWQIGDATAPWMTSRYTAMTASTPCGWQYIDGAWYCRPKAGTYARTLYDKAAKVSYVLTRSTKVNLQVWKAKDKW